MNTQANRFLFPSHATCLLTYNYISIISRRAQPSRAELLRAVLWLRQVVLRRHVLVPAHGRAVEILIYQLAAHRKSGMYWVCWRLQVDCVLGRLLHTFAMLGLEEHVALAHWLGGCRRRSLWRKLLVVSDALVVSPLARGWPVPLRGTLVQGLSLPAVLQVLRRQTSRLLVNHGDVCFIVGERWLQGQVAVRLRVLMALGSLEGGCLHQVATTVGSKTIKVHRCPLIGHLARLLHVRRNAVFIPVVSAIFAR